MPITIVHEPLDFTTHITNPVNLQGAMGAGLARQIASTFPDCLEPYRADLRSGLLREGTVTAWQTPHGNYVFQVPTKRRWVDPSPLELVDASLRALFRKTHELDVTELHTVPLGCGLGGLDWQRDVEPLMNRLRMGCNPALSLIVHLTGKRR